MRVHHLIVAAAASVAFAVTPALAKQVLVRGPPEIICEGISETAERSVQCGGDTAVIRFRQDEDDPNKVDEHTLRVTDGSIQLVSKVRSGYGDRDLTANVAFDSPPDRIVLDSGEAVELTAKVTCSGERIDNAGGPELSVNYAGTSVGVFGFSKTGERKLTSRGREGDVAAPDCGGEDGITHKIPFAARSNTGEFRVNVGTSGGAFFSIMPLRGQIYIRYPYTLVEEPAVARTCDFDEAIVELERDADGLALMGRSLQKMILLDLPEFPTMEFTLYSSGRRLQIDLKDPDSIGQILENIIESVESFVGTATDVAAHAHDMIRIAGARLTTGKQYLHAFLASPMVSGGGGGPALVGELRFLRATISRVKRRSMDEEEIAEFLRNVAQTVRNVIDLQNRMICTVKDGLPAFYEAGTILEAKAKELKSAIAEDSSCTADSSRMGQRLTRLVDRKLFDLRRVHAWHAAGLVKPPQASAAERQTWVSRHSWFDQGTPLGEVPRIYRQANCEAG